jgi:hypothetical protein
MPAAPRKVTAAEANDAAQLASLMQFKAALDPEGVLDKVHDSMGTMINPSLGSVLFTMSISAEHSSCRRSDSCYLS